MFAANQGTSIEKQLDELVEKHNKLLTDGFYFDALIVINDIALNERNYNFDLQKRYADTMLRIGRYNEAVRIFSQINKSEPEERLPENEQSRKLFLKGKLILLCFLLQQYNEASAHFSSIKEPSEFIKIYKGFLYLIKGELLKAGEIFNAEHKDRDLQSYISMGKEILKYFQSNNKDNKSARIKLDFLQDDLETIDEVLLLGSICMSAHQLYEIAHSFLDAIIESHKTSPKDAISAHIHKGNIYRIQDNNKMALQQFRFANELDPHNAELIERIKETHDLHEEKPSDIRAEILASIHNNDTVKLGNLKNIYPTFFSELKEDATTWLHVAAKEGARKNTLKFFLDECEIDVNAEDSKGLTPIYFAVKNQRHESTTYLVSINFLDLDKKYKIDAPDEKSDDNSAMEHTIRYLALKWRVSIDIIRILLPRNYNVNEDLSDADPMPILHMAAITNNIDAIKYFSEKWKANINKIDQKNMKSPLHYAACHNNIKSVDVLLSLNADVNLEDSVFTSLEMNHKIKTFIKNNLLHRARINLSRQNEAKKLSEALFSQIPFLSGREELKHHFQSLLEKHPDLLSSNSENLHGNPTELNAEDTKLFIDFFSSFFNLKNKPIPTSNSKSIVNLIRESEIQQDLSDLINQYKSIKSKKASEWFTIINEAIRESKLHVKINTIELAKWMKQYLVHDSRLTRYIPSEQFKLFLIKQLGLIKPDITEELFHFYAKYVINQWLFHINELDPIYKNLHFQVESLLENLRSNKNNMKGKRIAIIYTIVFDAILHYEGENRLAYFLSNNLKITANLFTELYGKLIKLNITGFVKNKNNIQGQYKNAVLSTIKEFLLKGKLLSYAPKTSLNSRFFSPAISERDPSTERERNFINRFSRVFADLVRAAQSVKNELVERKLTKNEEKANLGAKIASEFPIQFKFSIPIPVGIVPFKLDVDTNKVIEGGFKLWGYFCKIRDENRIEALAKFFSSLTNLDEALALDMAAKMIYQRYKKQICALEHGDELGVLKAASFAAFCAINYIVGEDGSCIVDKPGALQSIGHWLSRLFDKAPDVLTAEYTSESMMIYNGVVFGNVKDVELKDSQDNLVYALVSNKKQKWNLTAMFRNSRIQDENGDFYTRDNIEKDAESNKCDFLVCLGTKQEVDSRGFRRMTVNELANYHARHEMKDEVKENVILNLK